MDYQLSKKEVLVLQKSIEMVVDGLSFSFNNDEKKLINDVYVDAKVVEKLLDKLKKINEDIMGKTECQLDVTPVLYLMHNTRDVDEDSLKLVDYIKNMVSNHMQMINLSDTAFNRLNEMKNMLKGKEKSEYNKRIFEIVVDLTNLFHFSGALTQVNNRVLDMILTTFCTTNEMEGGD
jgi:hypothetical protein